MQSVTVLAITLTIRCVKVDVERFLLTSRETILALLFPWQCET